MSDSEPRDERDLLIRIGVPRSSTVPSAFDLLGVSEDCEDDSLIRNQGHERLRLLKRWEQYRANPAVQKMATAVKLRIYEAQKRLRTAADRTAYREQLQRQRIDALRERFRTEVPTREGLSDAQLRRLLEISALYRVDNAAARALISELAARQETATTGSVETSVPKSSSPAQERSHPICAPATCVTPHAYGVEVLGEGSRRYNQVVIQRHSPLPAIRQITFGLYEHQRSLTVTIYQGEAEDPQLCLVAGTVTLDDIPPSPAGTLVGLQIELSREGVLHFQGHCLGRDVTARFTSPQRMTASAPDVNSTPPLVKTSRPQPAPGAFSVPVPRGGVDGSGNGTADAVRTHVPAADSEKSHNTSLLTEQEITVDRLYGIFTSAYFRVQCVGKDELEITDHGLLAFVHLDSARSILTYSVWWRLRKSSSDNARLAFANRLNDQLLMVRFVIHAPDSLLCDYQLSYEGGVTAYHIVTTYKRLANICRRAVHDDKDDLIGGD